MKQAIAFVLDGSPSMLAPYPKGSQSGKSRFDCAKYAVESMIADLMLQSVTNEVCVIVCKTLETKHHKIATSSDGDELLEARGNSLCDVPFANLTELTLPEGVVRPSVDLLRRLSRVQATSSSAISQEDLQGDIIDGVLLAADALYERTSKKKYERQIVILTDAGHDIVMDVSQILVVIDSLRNMDCKLQVIGLDFELAGVYEEPAAAPRSLQQELIENRARTVHKKCKVEYDDDHPDGHFASLAYVENKGIDDDSSSTNEDGNSETEDEDDGMIRYSSKVDRERLLLSLTEKTGGEVIAASTLQQVLLANKGKKLQTATRRKMILMIAPGLQVEARYVLMMKKTPQETLKQEAVLVDDETKRPFYDTMTGKEMTDKVVSLTQYVDAMSNPDTAIDPANITTAIRFGSDLIPMSSFDFDGLRSAYIRPDSNDNSGSITAEPRMEILGYVEQTKVPNIYLQGPPYAISGNDSTKSAAAISAMAQALERLKKTAIVLFFKTKNSTDPILGALFPIRLPDIENYPSHPMHLVFLQLPFAGDVKKLHMASLEEYLDVVSSEDDNKIHQYKAHVCDNFIDALMLPDGCIESGKVPSPFLRSWNQTKVQRAIDNTADLVVNVRDSAEQLDPMITPPDILQKAQQRIIEFQEAFPLRVPVQTDKMKKKNSIQNSQSDTSQIKGRRTILTYSDFLNG